MVWPDNSGLDICETRPGLVPITFNENDRRTYDGLAGISAEVTAKCAGHGFREKMLITHRGLSGPAILQISSYWKKGKAILLDLAPDADVAGPLLKHRFSTDHYCVTSGRTRLSSPALGGALGGDSCAHRLDEYCPEGIRASPTPMVRVSRRDEGYPRLK